MDNAQNQPDNPAAAPSQESYVGQRVRQLRIESGWSIRALAEASGLAANTLSLIENGKISPSVGTLHRAAQALGVAITAFFEAPAPRQQVVFTSAAARISERFEHGAVEDLTGDFASRGLHPCLVTLAPHNGSGADAIVHTGYGLLLESHLPHRWQNEEDAPARMLLVLAPTDDRDRPTHRHFSAADPTQ